METLEKESFWDCVQGAETFESFKDRIVPGFKFRKEVNEEIVKSFAIVRKLLFHSYFEYDFLDPAMTKALTSFEMAMKQRYFEETSKKWGQRKSLQDLLYYFNDEGFFEYDRKGLMDAIRSLRNSQSHPEKYFGGGFGLMKVFDHCVDLINDSYEDIELRKERIAEKRKINKVIKKIIQNGGMMVEPDASFIIYDASIYFVDNTQVQKKYYGYFKMIFRLKDELNELNKNTDSLFLFQPEIYAISEDSLTIKFILPENVSISLTPITKSVNQKRFDTWHKQYVANNEDIMRDMMMNSEIDKQWGKIRRELHFNH